VIPRPQTIPQLVRVAAERFADRSAIEDGDVTLSFAELAGAGLRAARAFCRAGIQPGDRVAIWAPNIHEWVVAAIGLQSAGGVLVPLNTRMKGREVGYILAKSGARMLCAVEEFLGNRYVDMLLSALGGPGTGRPATLGGGSAARPVVGLPDLERIVIFRGAEHGRSAEAAGTHDSRSAKGGAVERSSAAAPGIVAWSDFLAAGDAFPAAEAERRAAAVSPDDLSDILFTSGTTGKPKGVMTTHGQNLRCFEVWSSVVGLREGDRYLIVNPFFHGFGYKAGWLAAIMRGATILPQAVFDVPAVLDRIGKERVSVLPGPPTLYQMILAHPERQKYDLSSLRLAVTGAAVIPVELIHRMRRELGLETIITAYGLTESTGVVTMCRPEDDPETIATTSGRAIPDVEVRCVDKAGQEVERGEPGEVVVRGYNVMKGYLDDPAATAEAIDQDGWLHTGDVGVMDARGYLRITDRLKDMFIVGGFNCYPAEIESIMHACDGIAQVAVIGVPDERMGEVGMAFVVPAPGAAPTPESIIAWCRENMANYKVPRSVEVVDALPMNATGKVTKFVLRERALRRDGKRGVRLDSAS
jgi:acyl-CoA synthetase (AMP-forming)/AMP-acid ligase II